MKKTIGILTMTTLLFCACGNKSQKQDVDLSPTIKEVQQNTTLSYVDEAEKLGGILQAYDKPIQRFQITSKKSSTVTGELGTIIHVNPANLETFDGQPPGEKIDVELKEYCTQADLLRGNVATVSDGRLIVSGGAYYINMSSDGNPLRIKQGKNLDVEFPKFANEEMELFYGQRDSLGQMNWMVAQQPFKSRETTAEVSEIADNQSIETALNAEMVIFESDYEIDTVKAAQISQEEFEAMKKVYVKTQTAEKAMYQAIKISRLGWINCDRFPNNIFNRTQLLIALNESENIRSVAVFLVFKDINSVMQSFYYPGTSASFNGIPVGYSVRLVAYSIDQEGELYTHSSDFVIGKDEKRSIELQESSTDELDKLFAGKQL